MRIVRVEPGATQQFLSIGLTQGHQLRWLARFGQGLERDRLAGGLCGDVPLCPPHLLLPGIGVPAHNDVTRLHVLVHGGEVVEEEHRHRVLAGEQMPRFPLHDVGYIAGLHVENDLQIRILERRGNRTSACQHVQRSLLQQLGLSVRAEDHGSDLTDLRPGSRVAPAPVEEPVVGPVQ